MFNTAVGYNADFELDASSCVAIGANSYACSQYPIAIGEYLKFTEEGNILYQDQLIIFKDFLYLRKRELLRILAVYIPVECLQHLILSYAEET